MAVGSYGDGVGPRRSFDIATIEDAERALTEILNQRTAMGHLTLTIDHGDENVLAIATNGRHALLVHFVGTDKESYSSLAGDDHGESFVFDYDGHWSEAASANVVPLVDARDALRAFVLTGRPTPSAVRFERD